MSYRSAFQGHETGREPAVVIVVDGTHDISRLANLFRRGLCEHIRFGDQILRQLKRQGSGRAALDLLHHHGGPDLLMELGGPDPLGEENHRLLARIHLLEAELMVAREMKPEEKTT